MGKPQRKHGPRLQERDARFNVRLTPAEALRLEALRDNYGMDKSALFRAWLRGTSLPAPHDQLRRLLLILDNRLEFLARQLQGRTVTNMEDVLLMGKLAEFSGQLRLLKGLQSLEAEGGKV